MKDLIERLESILMQPTIYKNIWLSKDQINELIEIIKKSEDRPGSMKTVDLAARAVRLGNEAN